MYKDTHVHVDVLSPKENDTLDKKSFLIWNTNV